MQRTLTPEFTFAGFTWPRYVATLACGPDALREQREQRKVTGGYYHAPRPNANGGRGFYLGDAGMPCNRKRWEWASDRAWGTDPDGFTSSDTTIRGIILRLSHGRFLAGWSMGEGMASGVGADLYTNEQEARDAADEEARITAERECENELSERERIAQEDRR